MLKRASRLLKINKKFFFDNKTVSTATYSQNFDTKEEILENYLGNLFLMGINLPDSKNRLTETAAEKLCESIKKFNDNDDFTVGILHGCGGNFCTGVVTTEKAVEKSKEIIEVLNTRKKPILCALSGHTRNYGFHLAVMCDMKTIETPAVIGFGFKDKRQEISDIVYKKFFKSVGSTKGLEMVLTNCSWNAAFAYEVGFVNRIVPCGSALGQCVVFAQSIALSPLEEVIKERSKILSFYE